MFFKNPKPYEIQAVKTGKAEFGLAIEKDIVFLIFRFLPARGNRYGITWSDSSYSWHMLQKSPHLEDQDRNILPPDVIGLNQRTVLDIVLVNAPTGITLALRQVSFSHEFTEKLFQAIRDQAQRPFDQVKYDMGLQKVYSDNDSEQLLKRAIVRCTGGD
jgi:hypothetical protein